MADTSIWADHLRRGDETMESLLDAEAVLVHPYVVGEIALGNLPRRSVTLLFLNRLPRSLLAGIEEVLFFVERHQLFGSGIGYVDAHLIVATSLTPGAHLWTRDKKLRAVAEQLSIAAEVE